MINRAVAVKQAQVVFICSDKMISKCLYNIFLAVQRIRRATLAGFGENNGVVYTKYHKSIICITVLYELIKGIMMLYIKCITVYCMAHTVQLCS